MKKSIPFSIIIFLSLAGTALANPVPLGTSPPEFISVLFESVLAAIILYRLGFDPVRIIYVWLPMTWVTFILLVVFVALPGMLVENAEDGSSIEYILWNIPWVLALIVGEVLVVLFEAWALRRISLRPFFYRNRSEPVGVKQSLYLSALINSGSLLMGIVLALIYVL